MNKNSTKNKENGRSEKLLLIAIMAVGILGLTFSYGSKRVDGATVSASASDTTSSDGKIQSDRMILNLNQKDRDTQMAKKVIRF